jgi:hypothetical protein
MLLKHLSNLSGWRTHRKIVVIESDDWGSIGLENSSALKALTNVNILPVNADEARYIENDTLASEKDFSALFDVLNSVKDSNGNSPVFTAVAVVANPDFKKIKEADYQNYFYEPFTTSLQRFSNHTNSFQFWKEGIEQHLFVPQFHGREHLNVSSWMRALRAGKEDTRKAFDLNFYGITDRQPINHVAYRAAFDIDDPVEIPYLSDVIRSGLALFQQLFGYKASFFVPTNGPFNNSLERTLAEEGIQYLGASKIQREPIGHARYRKRFHYLGQRNHIGQTYLTRNCFFEPNSHLSNDCVDTCIKEIEIAFRCKKPAVISSHRCNYIGHINRSNQERGLKALKKLLNNIVKKWSEVEFMTSEELGREISHYKTP